MIVVAFDTETWPVREGLKAPRMVCGQFASEVQRPDGPRILAGVYAAPTALDKIEAFEADYGNRVDTLTPA